MKTITLWITDHLPFLWRALGVNYPQLRAILGVKLTLDNRRPATAFQRQNKGETESNYSFYVSLAIYAFMGIFAALMLALVPPAAIVPAAVFFFGYVMVICALTLINDFSSVVLDTSDNQIMLFRPVDGRTTLIARIVHVVSYLFTLTLAISITGIIVISVRFGVGAGLLTLLLSLLTAVLMVFITNVLYLSLMQFTSESRLRELINYVQIITAIVFYAGFQIMPRLIDKGSFTDQTFTWTWWHYLLPPYWSAGSLDMLINHRIDGPHLLVFGLIIVMPFAGLWLMARVLAPAFNRKLGSLDAEANAPEQAISTGSTAPATSLADRLGGWLTTNSLERAAFSFVWHISDRDRQFKLRAYPQLGYGLAFVLFTTLSKQGAFGGSSQGGTTNHLLILYMGVLFMMAAMSLTSVSDHFKAAWVYASAPITRPGDLLAGRFKAVVVKLMLPYFALLTAYVFYLKGPGVVLDVVLAFLNSLAMLLMGEFFQKRSLPFSTSQDALKRNMTARSFIILPIFGLICFLHWGLSRYIPYGTAAAIPVMGGFVWLLFRAFRQTTWGEIIQG
jgi:ABC-2 type transport system permease protein